MELPKFKITKLGKNIVTLVFIVLVVWFAYNFFVKKEVGPPGIIATSAQTEKELRVVEELLIILRDLQRVRIDTGIFDESAYLRLRDFGVSLVQQPRGRRNPFAPFDEEGGI